MQSIWATDRREWPRAASRYVFLADALGEVGKTLFADWTGNEVHDPADDASVNRRTTAADWIIQKALDGNLRTFLWVAGRHPVPYNSGVWNRIVGWDVFVTCKISAPLPPRYVDEQHYVFLDRAELSQAIDHERRKAELASMPARYVTRAPEPPKYKMRGTGGGALKVSTPQAVPAKPAARPSTGLAIIECRAWLREKFADPKTAAWRRADFLEGAKGQFGTRLSDRGFNKAWSSVVVDFPERTKPGAPRKS